MIRSDEMMSKGRKLFRLSCIITAIGVFISVCSFVDGTFWRGFGENELVILLIFLAVFDTSLLYMTGYFLVHRLPFPEETAEEPLWFRRTFYLAFSPIALIIGFGIFNGLTGTFTLFTRGTFWDDFMIGAYLALGFLLLVPVIFVANLIIILYLYRRHKRKKYISLKNK